MLCLQAPCAVLCCLRSHRACPCCALLFGSFACLRCAVCCILSAAVWFMPCAVYCVLFVLCAECMCWYRWAQYRCHCILAALRPTPTTPSNPTPQAVYCVPRGFLFRWIVSPHYTCEVGIYTGLALLAYTQPPTAATLLAWWPALFTALNLSHAAVQSRRWALAHIPGYPKHRAALLPFVL